MLRLHTFCIAILLALFAGSFVGCGSGNVGLSGKVTFSDDGSAVPAGTVAFRKDGKIARGRIKEDGTFVVGFEKETDGLPPGRYEVFISGAEKVIGTNADGENTMEPLIDEKYNRAETSGLSLEVNSSTRVYNIEVERYKASSGRR